MKKSLIFLFSIFMLSGISSQNIITAKKVARIGNEIILQTDVEKYAKLYEVSIEEAKTNIINESILYYGAKINSQAPLQEEIDKQIQSDKNYFALRLGIKSADLTDEVFLSMIKMNIYTIKSYKDYVKRTLWINKYLKESLEKEKKQDYVPDSKTINEYLSKHPELFEEKEGVLLSMIFFSNYDENGKKKSDDLIKTINDKSASCLKDLAKGESFEKTVVKYTDDLISLNNVPKGRVGVIYFDDPRINDKFTPEIINTLKTSDKGYINKVFITKDGSFIFQIDDKYHAKKYSKEESMLKAEALLRKEHNYNLIVNVKTKLVEDLKKTVEMEVY